MSTQYPWILTLLPLSLLPLWRYSNRPLEYSSLELLPPDRLSTVLDWGLRLIAMLLIATLIIALSSPYRPPQTVERLGQGAQIVLLLDRSRSMDQPFVSGDTDPFKVAASRTPKGWLARELLAQFVAGRNNDLFAMFAFSTYPIQILPFTDKQDIIQAAIAAGNVGRGLSETDIGAALISALQSFENHPYTGSRIVLMVSDGGARLDLSTQVRLRNLFRRQRAGLYWIYLRSRNSPGLFSETANNTAPERVLHHFFSNMGAPYRAYTAENPDALQRAIADVNRLQNLPIHYLDTIPRRDLTGWFYGLAFALLALLTLARLAEVKSWH